MKRAPQSRESKAQKTNTKQASKPAGKGKAEADVSEHEERVEAVERGHAYFFYRPKVESEHAHAFKDVQRLYVALSPVR